MIRAYNLGTGPQWPSLWRAYALRSSRRHRRPDQTGIRPTTSSSLYHTRMDSSLDSFYPPCPWFFQYSFHPLFVPLQPYASMFVQPKLHF
jgi:hypothetical protein